VRYNVGSVFESLGRKQQAKAEYRAALALDPQFADAARRLSELEGGGAAAQPPQPALPISPPPQAGLSQTETGLSQTEMREVDTGPAPLDPEDAPLDPEDPPVDTGGD